MTIRTRVANTSDKQRNYAPFEKRICRGYKNTTHGISIKFIYLFYASNRHKSIQRFQDTKQKDVS